MKKNEIEVRERIESTSDFPLWEAIVTTSRGTRYKCTFAGEKPTIERVTLVWNEDKKSFDRF